MSIPKIHWIASFPKSGNTFARMLLNAYSTGFLDINAIGGHVAYDCDHYYHNSLSPEPLADMSINETLMLRTAVLIHAARNSRFKPVAMKTHNANVTIGGIALFPETLCSTSVYLLRDPRDVALSFARHYSCSVDDAITRLGDQHGVIKSEPYPIYSYISSWSNHVLSWLRVSGVTAIKFEGLKQNTETCFEAILKAVGLDVEEDKAKRAVEVCALENAMKQEKEHGFVEAVNETPFFGQGKGWQNNLTEAQVRQIEQDHGEVMEKVGYSLEYL